MSQSTVPVNTSSTKRKYGEDGLPNETPTTPSTPSMKTPTQNSTTITPTSNIIPSPPECHPLSQEFPVLSSFNPGLLQRGTRLVNGVDLDCQLFHDMIDETVRLCAKLNEPLQFQYQNSKHGIRLIKLPMSKSNRGTVTPNIKKCLESSSPIAINVVITIIARRAVLVTPLPSTSLSSSSATIVFAIVILSRRPSHRRHRRRRRRHCCHGCRRPLPSSVSSSS
jgi:hypothetical protein